MEQNSSKEVGMLGDAIDDECNYRKAAREPSLMLTK
jgi:hypothetical protein